MPLLNGSVHRFWHGQLGIEPTTHGFGDRVATLVHVPAYCSLRAEPKPRPSGKEGGKEKEWRCRVSPCTPTLSHLFLLLHFVVQHHLISAFTYGAYSSFIAHSFRGQ